MCKNGRIWRWVDHTVGHSTLKVTKLTLLLNVIVRHCTQIYTTSFTDSNSNKHAFVKLLQSNDVDLLITFSRFINLRIREYVHVYR